MLLFGVQSSVIRNCSRVGCNFFFFFLACKGCDLHAYFCLAPFSGCIYHKNLSPKYQQQWQHLSGYSEVTVVTGTHHLQRYTSLFKDCFTAINSGNVCFLAQVYIFPWCSMYGVVVGFYCYPQNLACRQNIRM